MKPGMPLTLKIFLSLGVGVCLILSRMDSLWSQSVDLAHHYVLTARIAEQWVLSSAKDPTLWEMDVYPRFSHIAAALAGSLFGSPLIGLQVVSLVANLGLWAGFVYILTSLPRYLAFPSALVFVGALLVNKFFLHAGLFHGSEIVGVFFFAQLAAQALAVLLLALALKFDQSIHAPVQRNVLIAVFIFLMTGVHLLATLEILGVLVGLVVLDLIVIDSEEHRRSWKKFLIGVLIVIVTTVGIIHNPDFKAMREISANNGDLTFPYLSTIGRLCWLAVFVMAISCIMIFAWWKSDDQYKRDRMSMKYLGLYGLSVGALCIAQFVATKFGYGSEYAVKKYVYGIVTVLLAEMAVFAALALRNLSGRWIGSGKLVDSPGGFFVALFLTGACFICSLPSNKEKLLDTSDLVLLEHQVKLMRDTLIPNLPGTYDIVIDMAGMPSSINYLLSIGILRAPRALEAIPEVLFTERPTNLAQVGSIIAAVGSPYDTPECRHASLRSGLVLLDAGCVSGKLPSKLPK